MIPAELLAELAARDIRIEVIGGRLRVEAPPGAMPAWLQAAMLEHRAKLLALLEAEDDTGTQGRGDTETNLPLSPPLPVSVSPPLPVGPEGTVRIPLDDLVYGDFLERNKLRIQGGAAYPDGRHYRPTIYLADDAG